MDGHGHTHARAGASRLRIVLLVTLTVLVVEIVGAYVSNSIALLADAGHMATDVAGIALALGAIWIAGRPTSDERTFGFLRLEILAAAINAVLLFGLAAFILIEAIRRFSEPPEVVANVMFAVALVGLIANAISLRLLHAGQKKSLNIRGAYLEVLGDFLGSVAVVIAAVVVAVTGWTGADAAASIVIAVLIVPRTFSLLREAVDILLEATPRGVDMSTVREHIGEAQGVLDVHDLHAWTITSGMNVLSAHVVIAPDADPAAVLDELCECLADDFDIEHSTLQLETADRRRLESTRHA